LLVPNSDARQVDLLVPEGKAAKLKECLDAGGSSLQYARVYIKLGDIVDGDFFNKYIKTSECNLIVQQTVDLILAGNILMRSESRPDVDHVYSLCDGVLRLEVNKPTFERLGLEGKAIPSHGRKHVKARYGQSKCMRRCQCMLTVASYRAQSQAALHGPWKARIREDTVGLPERAQSCRGLALL
jgi:hypothetical protein